MTEQEAILLSMNMYSDGYNQALEDIFNLAKQNSYDDGVDYSIGLQKLDELIASIRK